MESNAINTTAIHHAFYASIICWETLTTILCFLGAHRFAQNLRTAASSFNAAKPFGMIALTLSLLMWFIAFLSVGAEWFLMWQPKTWNGQEAAARMFNVVGIVLIYLAMPDTESQP